jgi:transcriptional regulator with XRE-family HTH domain
MGRGLTQQRAAKEAKVSRAQLALLEQGGNVSIKFLLKIARFLDLTDIPLDGGVQLRTGAGEGLNVVELVDALDLVASLVEHVRGVAISSILPPSERAKLQDTHALREFVGKHLGDDSSIQRIASAIAALSDDSPAGASPPRPEAAKKRQQPPLRRVGRRAV